MERENARIFADFSALRPFSPFIPAGRLWERHRKGPLRERKERGNTGTRLKRHACGSQHAFSPAKERRERQKRAFSAARAAPVFAGIRFLRLCGAGFFCKISRFRE